MTTLILLSANSASGSFSLASLDRDGLIILWVRRLQLFVGDK